MIIHTSEQAIGRLPQIQLDSSFALRDIVHMILAGGPSQTLYNLSIGTHQRALDFLCRESAAIHEDTQNRPYFIMDELSGKLNETMGVLAISDVNFHNSPILTAEKSEGTLEDLADAAAKKFALSPKENSWSLMLFSIFPGVTAEWINDRGEMVSVEKILFEECQIPYGRGACFGTHRLEGVAFSLRRFCLEQDIEPAQLKGQWADAYEYIQGAIRLIKINQREDGSIRRCWFGEKSIPLASLEWREKFRDLVALRISPDEAIIYPTGHCLDAISPMMELFPSDREWVDRACYILGQTIETGWTEIGRKIAPLTHAIHALKLLDV
jgi:hypothetical protein